MDGDEVFDIGPLTKFGQFQMPQTAVCWIAATGSSTVDVLVVMTVAKEYMESTDPVRVRFYHLVISFPTLDEQ